MINYRKLYRTRLFWAGFVAVGIAGLVTPLLGLPLGLLFAALHVRECVEG